MNGILFDTRQDSMPYIESAVDNYRFFVGCAENELQEAKDVLVGTEYFFSK